MFSDLFYQAIADALTSRNALMTASEAHGALTGMLCAGDLRDSGPWLSGVFGEGVDTDAFAPDHRKLLERMYQSTRRVLEEESHCFNLLLPDDETPLPQRAEALGEWCRGFLYGLGCSGDRREWPKTSQEIVRDLVEIGRLDPHAGGEADETAYMQLLEYIRIATQLIHSEMSRPIEQKTLH